MKLFYKIPQNIYIETSFNSISTLYNQYAIYGLRETETGEEKKFVIPITTDGSELDYFYPFDYDFLLNNICKLQLQSADGSYSSQLIIKKHADGKKFGFPLETYGGVTNQYTYDQSFVLTSFESVNFETADGKYCIYYTCIGSNNDSPMIGTRDELSLYSTKVNIHCVLTDNANYMKQLGVYKEADGSIVFKDNIEFWTAENGFISTNFFSHKTGETEFKIVEYDSLNGARSKSCYRINDGILKWESTIDLPPDGYELEYDIKTVERWSASNDLFYAEVFRLPPWNGNRCIYAFSTGSTKNNLPDVLSVIRFDEEEKKWFLYNSSNIKLYSCDTIDDLFLNSDNVYHFDFIGQLNENDDPKIADGFDLALTKKVDLTTSLSDNDISSYIDDDYFEQFKIIVENYKRETGFPQIVIFDSPVFI